MTDNGFEIQSDLPQKLYRFRSNGTDYFWDELENAIRHRRIFLSSASGLNDPFDFAPAYKESSLREVNQAIAKRGKKNLQDRDTFSRNVGRSVGRSEFRKLNAKLKSPVQRARAEIKMSYELYKSFRRHMKVSCFSENLHSAPMWSHYSNDHRGYCIEYEINWDVASDLEVLPSQVFYRTERASITTLDVLEYTEDLHIKVRKDERMLNIFFKLCLVKGTDWSYEREWRVFKHDEGAARYHHVPCLVPRRLIFGANSERSLRLDADREFGSLIEVCHARPSKTNFDFTLSEPL